MSMYSELNIDDAVYMIDERRRVRMDEHEILRVKSRICKALVRVCMYYMESGRWKYVDFNDAEVIKTMNAVTDYVFNVTLSKESSFINEDGIDHDVKELWKICTTYYFEDEFAMDYMEILKDALMPHFSDNVVALPSLNVKARFVYG